MAWQEYRNELYEEISDARRVNGNSYEYVRNVDDLLTAFERELEEYLNANNNSVIGEYLRERFSGISSIFDQLWASLDAKQECLDGMSEIIEDFDDETCNVQKG